MQPSCGRVGELVVCLQVYSWQVVAWRQLVCFRSLTWLYGYSPSLAGGVVDWLARPGSCSLSASRVSAREEIFSVAEGLLICEQTQRRVNIGGSCEAGDLDLSPPGVVA